MIDFLPLKARSKVFKPNSTYSSGMKPDLHNLIARLPDNLKEEVYNFAAFLLEKQGQKQTSQKPRVMDLHKGQVWMSDDFDEPLPDEFWFR